MKIANKLHDIDTHLSIRCSLLFVISVQSIRQLPRVGAQLNQIEQIKSNRDLEAIVLRCVAVNDEAAVENLLAVDFQLWSVQRERLEHFVEQVHGDVALSQRLSDRFNE